MQRWLKEQSEREQELAREAFNKNAEILKNTLKVRKFFSIDEELKLEMDTDSELEDENIKGSLVQSQTIVEGAP